MTEKSIIETLNGDGQLWDIIASKWIHAKDLTDEKNFFAVTHDGGDTYIQKVESPTELKAKLLAHLKGNGFAPRECGIDLIVENGEQKLIDDFLK